MGRVWVADHRTLKIQVAVKFLGERAEGVPEAVARFSVEAEAAARIKSPHVVQVFDHGVSDGTPYIVMELLEGEDLARRLGRERRLRTSEVVAVVRQIGKALAKAHAAGVVHRDIKPANVFLVSGMGEIFVKVLDFGLAKHGEGLGGMTGSAAIFGTAHYVSPEQAESARAATPRSDLWSVAVIAYECLTGTRPFEASSLLALCRAIDEGRYAPPSSLCPELPAAVDEWFARAFQRDPADRFASASELATTFAEALADAPDQLPVWEQEPSAPLHTEPGWSGTLGLPRRRRPRTLLAIAAAALAGAGAIGLFVTRTPPRAAAPAVAPTPAAATRSTPSDEGAPPPSALPPPESALPQPQEPPATRTAQAPAPSPRPRPAPAIPAASRKPTAAPVASSRAQNHDLFSDPEN
jgi:serine/threonine-protein kinase